MSSAEEGEHIYIATLATYTMRKCPDVLTVLGSCLADIGPAKLATEPRGCDGGRQFWGVVMGSIGLVWGSMYIRSNNNLLLQEYS